MYLMFTSVGNLESEIISLSLNFTVDESECLALKLGQDRIDKISGPLPNMEGGVYVCFYKPENSNWGRVADWFLVSCGCSLVPRSVLQCSDSFHCGVSVRNFLIVLCVLYSEFASKPIAVTSSRPV
jgi:hypothetical protein